MASCYRERFAIGVQYQYTPNFLASQGEGGEELAEQEPGREEGWVSVPYGVLRAIRLSADNTAGTSSCM